MNPRTSTRFLSTALAGAFTCCVVWTSVAHALESCKAKIAKDGAIKVSAKDVSGGLQWGNATGQEVNAFANAATCLVGDVASKCELGTGAQRITPPELCTVFLADTTGSCSAFLKGCTPGLRAGAEGFVAKTGDVMTGPLRAPMLDTGAGVAGCSAGDVCAESRLVSSDGADIGGALVLQSTISQGSSIGGVVKAAVIVDCDATPTIVRSFNTTGTGSFTVSPGAGAAECAIATPFSISNRFFSVTALDGVVNGNVADAIATLEVNGSTTLLVGRVSEASGVLTPTTGLVSIVIY